MSVLAHAADEPPKSKAATPPAATSVPTSPSPKAPSGRVIFNQHFTKVGDPLAESIGTGFFARSPAGEIVAITSMHFLEIDGPAYELVTWTDAKNQPVTESSAAFGTPGNLPDWDADFKDFRKDYLILKLSKVPENIEVLELDDRAKPEARSKENNETGEPIWFPYRAQGASGSRWIQGDVSIARRGMIIVILKNAKDLEFQGCSGSPVLSQRTGKVIGILSSGGDVLGQTVIQLAPIPGVLKALKLAEDKQNFPALRDVVWSKHGVIKKPAKDDTKSDSGEVPPK
jgi:hypothetical protein